MLINSFLESSLLRGGQRSLSPSVPASLLNPLAFFSSLSLPCAIWGRNEARGNLPSPEPSEWVAGASVSELVIKGSFAFVGVGVRGF